MSILEKNFPSKVLHVQSQIENTRLDFQKVTPLVEKGKFKAITSHLVSRPPFDSELNPLVITLLRNPSERLISAYEFQRDNQFLTEGDVNFQAFLTRRRFSVISNYQTRLLSPQSWNFEGTRIGWELNPRAIDLTDENLFVGTVEMFDQSMVLLEQWLKDKGVEFDASYSVPRNTALERGSTKPEFSAGAIFPDMIEIDEHLWLEVTQRIESKISLNSDFNDKMIDFARRREAFARLKIPQKSPQEIIRL
jgi:hypothetical protein